VGAPAAGPFAGGAHGGPPVEGQPVGGGPVGTDRAPAIVLFLSALVVAAVVGGGIYLVTQGGAQYPSKWDDRVAPIAAWVAAERGLDFEHPVEVNFLTDEEYAAETRVSEDLVEEDAEEIADAAAEFRALGLLSGEFDVVESVNTLSDSGTLAFYSPSTQQVYVRGQTLTPALRVTLAHELVHVLQDQHFDLDRMAELSSTRAGVLRAVAEGDAGRVEERYVEEVLTDAEREEYEAESVDDGQDAVDEIREEVPDALTALFAAPYVFGEPLVTYLYETDGQSGIDAALQDPPSEQVLFNPFLWKQAEADDVEVDVVMPPGATEITRDDFGPIAWYLVLSSRLDPKEALAVVDGLGGDAYVTFRDGDRVCVRATVVGDDDAATARFESALTAWVQAGPEGAGSVSRDDDDHVRFQGCDPGEGAEQPVELTLEVLALPATRTQLYLETRSAGASRSQAWCVATGVLDLFSFTDLIDPTLPERQDVTGSMMGVMEGCVAAG
jgi:hypothetical protein